VKVSDVQIKYLIGIAISLALLSFYTATNIEQKVDNRFKSYDMLFLLDHSSICLEATTVEAKEHYMKFKSQVTPLGRRWIEGDYLCPK